MGSSLFLSGDQNPGGCLCIVNPADLLYQTVRHFALTAVHLLHLPNPPRVRPLPNLYMPSLSSTSSSSRFMSSLYISNLSIIRDHISCLFLDSGSRSASGFFRSVILDHRCCEEKCRRQGPGHRRSDNVRHRINNRHIYHHYGSKR